MYENRFEGISVVNAKSFNFPLHSHYNIELCVCIEGEICAECNGKKAIMHPGDIMLALSNDIHGYHKTAEGRQIMMIVSPRALPSAFGDMLTERYENFGAIGDADVLELSKKIYEESRSENNELAKIGYISLLLSVVLKQLPKKESVAQLKEDVFTNVVKYISEHYTENITLRSVASKFGIDYFNLSKMFTLHLSLTFTHYVHLLRIEEAKALLRNTDKSITEICYECGFSDIRTFNRVFKQITEKTPKEFRN